MAKFSTVNNPCSRGGISAMFSLKTTLVSTGKWRVSASGDGTTFFANSDGLTSSGTGAGGFANNSAWYHLIDNNEKFSLLVWHGDAGHTDNTSRFWVKICPSGNYKTGGVVGTATRLPTHPNEEVLWGYGKNADPETKISLFGPAGGSGGEMYSHIIASNVEENGIYPFWFMGVSRSSATCNTLIALEPLASQSYHPSDQYPWLFFIKHDSNANGVSMTDHRSTGLVGTIGNIESTTFTPIFGTVSNTVSNSLRPMFERSNEGWTTYGNPVFTSSYDGSETLIPFQVFRAITSPAYRKPAVSATSDVTNGQAVLKGSCKYIKIVTNPARTFPDTYNLSTDAYIVFGATALAVTIPWPENVTPLIS